MTIIDKTNTIMYLLYFFCEMKGNNSEVCGSHLQICLHEGRAGIHQITADRSLAQRSRLMQGRLPSESKTQRNTARDYYDADFGCFKSKLDFGGELYSFHHKLNGVKDA